MVGARKEDAPILSHRATTLEGMGHERDRKRRLLKQN